jgi:hypothetical protein
VRPQLLQQMFKQLFAPRGFTIGHAEIEVEIRKALCHDPIKAERAVGHMYGYAFRKAEEAYARRGFKGKQDWTGVPVP